MKKEWKYNSVTSNNTVFVMRIRYANERTTFPVSLREGILGVFTNLEYAEHFLKMKRKGAYNFLGDKPFKIYEIEEIALNYFWNFVRTRFYDHEGRFYGEHTWDEPDAKKEYKNRLTRYRLVEFIDGAVLRMGVIACVPPDKDKSPFKDYYIILHGTESYCCSQIVSHHVFPLSAKIPADHIKLLLTRLKEENANPHLLQEAIKKKEDLTTYRVIV